MKRREELPLVSIIMPTYNADKIIGESLQAIKEQTYPQEKIEILVIDGGSTDKTIDIAQSYGAKIINNPERLPEAAKEIGLNSCRGEYALYVDSDEMFINKESLEKRIKIFRENNDIKVITSTGKISKENASAMTKYSNYVSDPFSFLVYNLNGNNRLEELKKKYHYKDFGYYVEFNYFENDVLPLFDAAMNMFEVKFVKDLYGKSQEKNNFAANIFEYSVKESGCSAMLKDDFIYHEPNETMQSFLSKMKWRVYNNVFVPKGEGIGFAARGKRYKELKYKKIFFVLYSCLIIPVLLHSIYITIKKRNVCMLLHFVVNEYVMFWIGIYMSCKIVGIIPKRKKQYGKK